MRKAAYLALLLAAPAFAAEPTGTAVEYYNGAVRHYFLTADPEEMRLLETGAAGPWVRTGGRFSVYRQAGDAPDLAAVCRFYGTPGVGPNSHFYTADAAECEQVKRAPGWTYEGIGFHAPVPRNGSCPADTVPVYRSYNDGWRTNDSNHRFTTDATLFANAASFGHVREGVALCAPLSAAEKRADAARLLRQGSFGPTPAEIERVAAMGPAAWVEEQLRMPVTAYPAYPWMPANRPDSCTGDCARDNYTLYPLQLAFFRNALAAPDQLRGRVAFALSQIMVTSGIDNSRNYAMREYQQLFLDRAFGNFHDLLLAVTLSPVMGDYLDMANNNKSDAARGTDPNENYAREILQLFSVGTYLLNADGTRQLDAQGRPRFTYELAEIKGFSRVFTGWTYPTVAGAAPRNNNPRNYLGPMRAVDANHDTGSKLLLRGVNSPANLAMAADLEFAHRNIFEHPNVGPFIGKQLIQKLVTSEPTPAYVARVSAAFADNGAGQRGDLKAVLRAILLDPEARGARKLDPGFGKLAEPVLYMTAMARALGTQSDGAFFRTASAALGQFVFYAPSVFNHYPFDYVVPGTQLLGPEFGIQDSATAIARANVANALLLAGVPGTTLDFSRYQPLAGDAGALADALDRDLLAGAMPAAMRAAIVSAVNAVPANDAAARARAAAYLVATSPHYQVQR